MGTQASSLKVKITDGQAGGEAARRSGWVSLAPRLERARTCGTGRPCCLRAVLPSCPGELWRGCPGGPGRGSGHRH